MDIFFDILLICHLLAFGVAVTSVVALPIVMSRAAGAPAESRPLFGGIGALLGRNARIALGVLLVSGVLMVWVRYGGVDSLSVWFWVKMALVALIIVVMIAGVVARGKINPGIAGWITRLALLGVVIAAVLAFN